MNAPDQTQLRRLKPGEDAPMKRFKVWRQWRPVEVTPANPRLKKDAEYRAVLTYEGIVMARDGSEAIAKAAKMYGLLLPIVQELAE